VRAGREFRDRAGVQRAEFEQVGARRAEDDCGQPHLDGVVDRCRRDRLLTVWRHQVPGHRCKFFSAWRNRSPPRVTPPVIAKLTAGIKWNYIPFSSKGAAAPPRAKSGRLPSNLEQGE